MKNLLLPFIACVLLVPSCKEKEENNSPVASISGGESNTKSWRITKNSTDDPEDHPTCNISHERNGDNSWVFSSDGSFEFDNGEITEDTTCVFGEKCCSDLTKLKGNWIIKTDNASSQFTIGDSLIITADQRKRENEENFVSLDPSIELIKGRVTFLSNEKMVWESTEESQLATIELIAID